MISATSELIKKTIRPESLQGLGGRQIGMPPAILLEWRMKESGNIAVEGICGE